MEQDRTAARAVTATEPERTPALSLVLGYGAMAPLVAAALWAWLAPGDAETTAARGAQLWGAAIVVFLAGVRRGLSFRTPGGARPGQLAMMLWLFGAGVVALVLPSPVPALALLLAACLSMAVIDLRAARQDEAPLYFERLRPLQMGIAVLALGAILLRLMVDAG